MTFTTEALAQDAQQEKTEERWDKVFPLSDKVSHRKVSFKNQFGITLIGDLYTPKNGKNGMAIAVRGLLGHLRNSRADSMP